MDEQSIQPRLGVCLNFLPATDLAPAAIDSLIDFLREFIDKSIGGPGNAPSWYSGGMYLILPDRTSGKPSWIEKILSALGNSGITGAAEPVILSLSPSSDMENVLSAIAGREKADQSESAVFHFWGDAPFLNIEVNAEILDLRRRYLCDYVFSEGYPRGIGGEIISDEILPNVARGGEGIALRRDGVFESVRQNINAYEIETAVSPEDLRMLRLDLFSDVKRNALICERLSGGEGLSPRTGATELCTIIRESEAQFRSLPRFFALQISAGCPQSCSYCPYPQINPDHLNDRRELSAEQLETVLDKIISMVEDPVVSLSAWGEPALHSDLPGLFRVLTARPSIRLLLETSGIGWSDHARAALTDYASSVPLTPDIILSLDSIDPGLYMKLRGRGFEEAMAFAAWAEKNPVGNFHVQAVRMLENEEHLMDFHRHWKDKGIRTIIQKYSDNGGTISSRQVADLSPLNRHACWHVKRELVMAVDGEVHSCLPLSARKNNDFSLGNLLTDDIGKIWTRGEALYESHISNSLPEVCLKCDEWYTFNF